MCGNPQFPPTTYDAVMMNRHKQTPERAIENMVAQGLPRSVALHVFLTSSKYAALRCLIEEDR